MNRFLLISILLLLLGCKHPESSDYERNQGVKTIAKEKFEDDKSHVTSLENKYKVIGVKDGDTFVLLVNENELVVRFAHIDCPEKKQPFGKNAKQFVSDKSFGTYVELIHNNKYDRSKRLIAEVILEDGTNLNKELVKQGLAWHYKSYSKDKDYAILEDGARTNKIGLWSDKNPIEPWNWRNTKKK